MKKMACIAFGLTTAVGIVMALSGCSASQSQKNAAADSAYAADQASCVNASSTREQADACRVAKRAMWDAGSEGGLK